MGCPVLIVRTSSLISPRPMSSLSAFPSPNGTTDPRTGPAPGGRRRRLPDTGRSVPGERQQRLVAGHLGRLERGQPRSRIRGLHTGSNSMWESVMRFHTHHLAERVLQPTSQPLVQGGQNVGVHGHVYDGGRVAQPLCDFPGTSSLRDQQRSAGMPQVVDAEALDDPGRSDGRSEHATTEVPGMGGLDLVCRGSTRTPAPASVTHQDEACGAGAPGLRSARASRLGP
jgi:hypothetical protein